MIELWTGDRPTFGTPGRPQKWVNILGRVEPGTAGNTLEATATLRARLNGGESFPVALGPDGRRLAAQGDFNVEIDAGELCAGDNTLELRESRGEETVDRRQITIRWIDGLRWPLPWSWDFAEQPLVVDGLWRRASDGLRTARTGYDRVLAFGDRCWRDYEVSLELTIHRMDRSVIGHPIQSGPAVMVVLRWDGHTEREGFRPRTGWYPYGACVCYGYTPELGRFGLSIQGNDPVPVPGDRLLAQDARDTGLHEGIPYCLRAFVRSRPGRPSHYGVRVWEAATAEPPEWQLDAAGLPSELAAGSCLLVAHNADVTLHALSILS